MRRVHALARLVVASTIAGCASAPGPEATPPPAPVPPPAPAPPPAPTGIVSPARWLVRHPEAITPTAAHPLPQGGFVYGGDGGERWVVTAETGDGGAAREASLIILPERIAGILPVDGRWAWFGVSGRAFLSATPLGPVDEVRMPPAPVLSVSRGRGAVFAVTRRGDLVRTADGGAHSASRAGVTASWPAAPIAAAFRTDGTGVALTAPQRAFVTTDDGASWRPISMPGTGPHFLNVSEEGDLWLGRSTGELAQRLSGQPPAFVKAAPPSHDRQRNDDAMNYESSWGAERAIVGRRVLAAASAQERWKIEVSELDREGEWKDVPAFEGCAWMSVSASGEDFVAACARAAADAGAPGGAKGKTPYRAVLYRSKDGASWAEDGEAPLWDRQIKVIAGPEGSILLRNECPGGSAGCARLSLRSAAGRPFAPLPLPEDVSPEDIAFDPVRRAPLAVERASDKPGHLYRWGPDGSAKRTIDLPGITYVHSLDVDAHGVAVHLADREGSGSPVLPVADDGSTIDDEPAPTDHVSHAAFAGDRGLLMDPTGHFWETASGGKEWKPTTGLDPRNGNVVCAKEGCVVVAERRLGWDLAGEGPAGPALAGPVDDAPRDRVPGAAPLRCAGTEAAKAIPRAMVRDLDEVATLGWDGTRVAVPAATKDFAVGVAVATLSGEHVTVKTQSLFEAAPNPASVGSQTDVRATPAGVIAARATYPVDRLGADVWISPVSLELAWWRAETQKVERARVPVSGKGQMRGTHELHQGSGRNELLWLAPEAAYYRPHVTFDEADQLHAFTGGGRSTKLATKLLQTAEAAARTASGPVLLTLPRASEWAALGLGLAAESKDPFIWTLAPPASNATILPLARGDETALVIAWSGPPDGPPRGYLVPLRPGNDPPEIADLGLAALTVEHPRACTGAPAPGAVRLRVSLPAPRAVRCWWRVATSRRCSASTPPWWWCRPRDPPASRPGSPTARARTTARSSRSPPRRSPCRRPWRPRQAADRTAPSRISPCARSAARRRPASPSPPRSTGRDSDLPYSQPPPEHAPLQQGTPASLQGLPLRMQCQQMGRGAVGAHCSSQQSSLDEQGAPSTRQSMGPQREAALHWSLQQSVAE